MQKSDFLLDVDEAGKKAGSARPSQLDCFCVTPDDLEELCIMLVDLGALEVDLFHQTGAASYSHHGHAKAS